MPANTRDVWLRRARPLLGTLVEIGVPATGAASHGAVDRAFDRVRSLQRRMSRFEAASDIGRFNALRPGEAIDVHADTRAVLEAAVTLQTASAGLFDISVATGPSGWQQAGGRLTKLQAGVRLDLGGIAKGHAVDCAVQSLRNDGVEAGWVNAGGDLRAFGAIEVPVRLRDALVGRVRPFATLAEGAFATSCGAPGAGWRVAHVSVAAPLCLWADALTKVIGLSGDAAHPLLLRHGAQAWIH